MTRARAKLLKQQVNLFLSDTLIDENFILPKSYYLCMIRYEEGASIARGGEEHLDKKLDMELDMELDMKIFHGRAREEREACAREEAVQPGARPGPTGLHAGPTGPRPGPTGRHAGSPGRQTGRHASAPGRQPGPTGPHAGALRSPARSTGRHAGAARSKPDASPVPAGSNTVAQEHLPGHHPVPGPVSTGPAGP